jgi:hypothetical protein
VLVLGEHELPVTADFQSVAGIVGPIVAWPNTASKLAALPKADVAIALMSTL